MKIQKLTIALCILIFAASCGGLGSENETGTQKTTKKNKAEKEKPEADPKGIGEVENVNLTDPLNENMIESGKAIYEMKCASCHKLGQDRVVGPGFADITNRRRPEWIMNMITNTDVMLEEDPVARKMLEECLTRMPNQGLTIGDARDVLEYMRKNDMKQVGKKDQAVKDEQSS
ncbi:MAG: c-type cytochrome [Bacteroidetes bacterium]|nr:c-type cytochrome [Bacteroidota bacterium]